MVARQWRARLPALGVPAPLGVGGFFQSRQR
jgi:hypothetical protein